MIRRIIKENLKIGNTSLLKALVCGFPLFKEKHIPELYRLAFLKTIKNQNADLFKFILQQDPHIDFDIPCYIFKSENYEIIEAYAIHSKSEKMRKCFEDFKNQLKK